MLCIVCLSTHCGLNGMTATDDQLITWRLRQQLICTHTRAHCAYTAKSYLHKEQTTPVLTKYRMHNNLAFYLSWFRKFSTKHFVTLAEKALNSQYHQMCVCGGGRGGFIQVLLGYAVQTKCHHVSLGYRHRLFPEGYHRRVNEVQFFLH